MALKFLPLDSNKINPMGAIGFGAYYDKNIVSPSKWRSVESNSHFLISDNRSTDSLNFHAAGVYAEDAHISWVKAMSIDKEGYIIDGNGILTSQFHVTSGNEFIINKHHNNVSILFSPTQNLEIQLPSNDDEIPVGFGCYLTKDGQILENINVSISIHPGFIVNSGYYWVNSFGGIPTSIIWTSDSDTRPLLMLDEKIYLYKINSKEWLLGFGVIDRLDI